jgi:hypothetical protein
MNGEAVGSAALTNNKHFIAHAIAIGGIQSAGANYRGHLDEIRLWSVARMGDEIRAAMYQEVRSGTDWKRFLAMAGALRIYKRWREARRYKPSRHLWHSAA